LATAVIPLAGVTLGIFVRHHRALSLEDCFGDDVLRSDQLDLVLLAITFIRNRLSDHRIVVGNGSGEEIGEKRGCPGGAHWRTLDL
jgi:hypothetical protein